MIRYSFVLMKVSLRKAIFLPLLVVLITSFMVSAQDYSSIDLKTIQVDALSDQQVEAFVKRAEASGMSQTQLEALARQRGMSEMEISKLRSRIYQINPESANQMEQALESKKDRLREDPMGPFLIDINDYKLKDLLEKGEGKKFSIFGSEMFKSMLEEEISFSTNLNIPTPKNYILGAGDELIIDVYGASEITYQNVISPDGQVIISGIGPIKVGGITVEQARSRLLNKLKYIYSGLTGRNPNTYAQISVGNIRTIKVHMAGHILRPGTYTLNSFSNIFNALYLSGGPNENGSYRKIRLVRNGKNYAVFDIYDYLFNPEKAENPILQDGDQIVVDPYVNRVSLTGEVKYPAKYELMGDETILDILNYSGGFTGNAYAESMLIQRPNGRDKSLLTIKKQMFKDEVLMNGDSINIGSIIDRFANRVSISGAVMRPGDYELNHGMMLSDLFESVEGLREDAFLGRGSIFRQNKDLTLKNIAFSVEGVMNGSEDVILQREDQVIIQSIFDLRKELTIQVKGEIRVPGMYPYLEKMTVEDLITHAGGFKESANKSVVEVARQIKSDQEEIERTAEIFTFEINDDLSLSSDASTFELQPFDVVLIKRSSFYQTQKLVKIEGEVLYPGFYALETREDKISDLIKRAGGITEFAYESGATILRRTEYFQDSVETYDLEAETYRSERLKELQQRDADSNVMGQQESIGINLKSSLSSPGSKHDLILKDGDVLSIPKQLQTVRVRGKVLYPNTMMYESGTSVKRVISQSGGFTDDSRPGKTYVIYANGSAERTRRFLWFKKFPGLEPGAEIIVPKRARERQPVKLQEIIGISSGLATLVLVITQLRK